jgi:hypothetical protein
MDDSASPHKSDNDDSGAELQSSQKNRDGAIQSESHDSEEDNPVVDRSFFAHLSSRSVSIPAALGSVTQIDRRL